MKKNSQTINDDKVQIISSSASSIKEKVGSDVDLKQELTSDIIDEVQDIIDDRQQDFLVWVDEDLKAMKEGYRQLEADLNAYEEPLSSVKHFALSVKSRGGTFGYDLASMVAKSLYCFCEQHFRPEQDHLLVMCKHMEGLETIFQHRIAGDGGKVGAELMGSLCELVDKYK